MVTSAQQTEFFGKLKDKQRVLEILENLPKRDIRRFNKFILHLSQAQEPILNYNRKKAVEKDHAGETILRLLNLSKHLTPKFWKDDFLRSTIRVINSEIIDEFEQLSKNVQSEVWSIFYAARTHNPVQQCADKAYLRLMVDTGWLVDEEGPDESYHTRNLLSVRQNTSQIIGESERIARIESFEPYGGQIFRMLNWAYGKQDVLEMLDHFKGMDEFICANEMIDILEDWENIKGYPEIWIRQTHGLGSCHE